MNRIKDFCFTLINYFDFILFIPVKMFLLVLFGSGLSGLGLFSPLRLTFQQGGLII
jgi:hypothetical protein